MPVSIPPVLRADAIDAVLALLDDSVSEANAAGASQVAAVNAAGASAVGQVAGSVAAAASSATSAQASATNAGNFAAQAQGGPYAAPPFASKSAFNTALPTLAAGLYNVTPDESQNGGSWNYRVNASHAVTYSYAVAVLGSGGSFDLIGPLRQNAAGAANAVVERIRPTAADTAAGYPDFVTRINRGVNPDNSPNWYVSLGWNASVEAAEGQSIANAAFSRLVFEEDYRPGDGAHWFETYHELKGYGNVPIRRPQFIVFDKVSGRTLSHKIGGDTLAFANGADEVVLQRFNNVWEFASGDRVLLQGEGALLTGGSPGNEVPLVGRTGNTVTLGSVTSTDTVFAPRVLTLGDIETSGTKLSVHANEGGGSIADLFEFRTPAYGNTSGGAGITYHDGSALRARLGFRNQVGVEIAKRVGSAWVEQMYLTDEVDIQTSGKGILARGADGHAYRLVPPASNVSSAPAMWVHV